MGGQSDIIQEKRVRVVAAPGANYVFHLLAVARAGFASEYADTYRNSVRPEDTAFITHHTYLLTYGGGSAGELADCFIGLPIYYELNSRESFEEYYSLFVEGLQTRNFTSFYHRYADFIEKHRQWFWPDDADLNEFSRYAKVIEDLGAIVLRNYNTYIKSVWTQEQPQLARVAARINEVYENSDFIARWEALTNIRFKFDEFQIVLSSAIKNGTNAGSMGYDMVVFYHDNPFDETIQLICHEIGTHILIDVLKEIRDKKICDFQTLFMAYECLARFYNTTILENKKPAYRLPNFPEQEYLEIYAGIFHKSPDISPRDLLVEGVKTFGKTTT